MPPTIKQYQAMYGITKNLTLDIKELLADRYGLESAKYLTRWQTDDFLRYLRKLQNPAGDTKGRKPVYYQDRSARKVFMLWKSLADAGVIKNRSEKAMDTFVKRQTGVASLRWCKEPHHFSALIETLKAWGNREATPAPSLAPAALEHPCSSEVDLD